MAAIEGREPGPNPLVRAVVGLVIGVIAGLLAGLLTPRDRDAPPLHAVPDEPT